MTITNAPFPNSLLALLRASSIPHSLPSDPDFQDLLSSSFMVTSAQPALVVRPRSAADAAAIVAHLAAAGQPVAVKAGGHDLLARHTVPGAVQLDLRLLNEVEVAEDGKTARVGGGATVDAVLKGLEGRGLVTAVGTVGTVGYVGWSCWGGYGLFSPGMGLGADQIVAAKLVNAQGRLVEADERVLRAMRGGGAGNWGVVTEVTVKVYPLNEIQSGTLIYEGGSNLTSAIISYFSNFAKLTESTPLPSALYLQPSFYNLPGQGATFMVLFVWAGPSTPECREWQDRIAALAPCVHSSFEATTPLAHAAMMTQMVPRRMFGGLNSVSLHAVGPEAAAAFAEAAEEAKRDMPDNPAVGWGLHSLAAWSPSANGGKGVQESVFRNRGPHFMVELFGLGATQEAAERAEKWAAETKRKLVEKGGSDVMEGVYFPLANNGDGDLDKMFGLQGVEELRALKKEVDPQNIFRYGLPSL